MLKIFITGNSELVVFGFRKELVKELVSMGHTVVAAFPQTEFGNGYDTAKSYGCTYIPIKINGHGKNPFEDMCLFSTYYSLLKKEKPDVVLTFTIKSNIYASLAAGLLKIPHIANITGIGVAIDGNGFVSRVSRFLYKIALKKPSVVFFQNSENMKLFERLGIAAGRHKLINGSGVNLEEFSPLEYPDEKDGIHFCFIARIMKKKGIRYYLDAAKEIKAKHPDTHFHILGAMCEKEYEKEIEQLCSSGMVEYHGLVKDVRKYHLISHCTVHPTYYPEGMSNVLLESFALARPALCTDRAGCREIVDDGINGFYFAERSAESLVEAIEKFLSLSLYEKQAMADKARTKVQGLFDRRQIVDEYIRQILLASDCEGKSHDQ